MLSVLFTQKLYIGSYFKTELNKFLVDGYELGMMCEMFAESHVAKPEAQFEDYVIDDVSQIIMSKGNADAYLIGTAVSPQKVKKTCQGVGGHLGEGVTALVFLKDINLPPSNFSHIGILSGPTMRCVDFVAITKLGDLYKYYKISIKNWEDIDNIFAFPIEAKSRKKGIGANCKSFLEDGAFCQIVSYWWACRGLGMKGPVGYGLATAFSYEGNNIISHCFIKPKSDNDRKELLLYLNRIRSTRELRYTLDDKMEIKQIQSFLEGF